MKLQTKIILALVIVILGVVIGNLISELLDFVVIPYFWKINAIINGMCVANGPSGPLTERMPKPRCLAKFSALDASDFRKAGFGCMLVPSC